MSISKRYAEGKFIEFYTCHYGIGCRPNILLLTVLHNDIHMG